LTTITKLLLLLILAFPLLAQTPYVVQKTTALTTAAEVITIQQPSSSAKTVEFQTAYVDCSVACTLTLERNGNAATTTLQTPTPVNAGDGASSVKAYNTSNVGVGTVLSVVSLPASGSVTYDLTKLKLRQMNDPGQNFTIRTSSITGTVNITVLFQERQQ